MRINESYATYTAGMPAVYGQLAPGGQALAAPVGRPLAARAVAYRAPAIRQVAAQYSAPPRPPCGSSAAAQGACSTASSHAAPSEKKQAGSSQPFADTSGAISPQADSSDGESADEQLRALREENAALKARLDQMQELENRLNNVLKRLEAPQ